MQLLKKHVCRIAVALALGAGTLVGGSSTASAAVHPQYWNNKCDYGRACIYDTDGRVFNADGCGNNPIRENFDYAKAYGNSFRVWYRNNTWDLVPAWSERTLDSSNLTAKVEVYC
ncbi:hypothetical protein ABZT23_38750 [Streptomyces sp. NPDC005386]|uniref:hypothetical protein n=1 Tax=Streptomyces sp. NPDC005386 TaxID=3154562 RepID=UPI0033AB9E82